MSRLTPVGVRRADPDSADQLGRLIAAALADDPIHRWLVPDTEHRDAIMPLYYAAMVQQALTAGEVHTIDDYTAVAVWFDDPGSATEFAPHPARYLAELSDPYLPRFRLAERALYFSSPTGLTCHRLAFLAVHPNVRGQGIGASLLRFHTDNADARKLVAFAQASTPGRRLLYAQHGFRERPSSSPHVAADAPVVWPMVRQPDELTAPVPPGEHPAGQPNTGFRPARSRNERQPYPRRAAPLDAGASNRTTGLRPVAARERRSS